MAVKLALGILFILNSAAFTLISAAHCSSSSARKLIRSALTVTAVNIAVNALTFIALY